MERPQDSNAVKSQEDVQGFNILYGSQASTSGEIESSTASHFQLGFQYRTLVTDECSEELVAR